VNSGDSLEQKSHELFVLYDEGFNMQLSYEELESLFTNIFDLVLKYSLNFSKKTGTELSLFKQSIETRKLEIMNTIVN